MNRAATSQGRPEHNALLKRMAFLRREFIGRRRFDAGDNGSVPNTIYFYDTDVVTTFTQPWARGATYVQREQIGPDAIGYGEPLPIEAHVLNAEDGKQKKDIQNIANRIAEQLAEHALIGVRLEGAVPEANPTSKLPLYQFPGHYGETRSIFANAKRLAEAAGGTTSRGGREEAMRRAMALLHFTSSRGDTGHTTLDILTSLLDTMAGQDLPLWKAGQKVQDDRQRRMEWRRFVELNQRSNGLFELPKAGDHAAQLGYEELHSALAGLDDLSRREKTIHSKILTAADQHGLDAKDAEAIATLFTINARLIEADWRALFVTGSSKLANFCYELGNFGLSNDGLPSEFARTFSQRYVRHLFSYVPDAILDKTSSESARFHGLLDGALSIAAAPDGYHQDRLSNLYQSPERFLSGDTDKKALKVFHDSSASLIQSWNTVCRQAIASDRFRQIGLSETEGRHLRARVMTIISRHGQHGHRTWDEMIRHAMEEYARSRDRTYLSYSMVGRHALVFREEDDRNPPPLWFDALTSANKVFAQLAQHEDYDADKFAEHYKEIADECRNADDPEDDRLESYTKYVVLGAAFASMNRWPIALSQGQNALAIIDRTIDFRIPQAHSVGAGSPLTGREAAFLCAVAHRLSGSAAYDFDRAEEHLDRTVKAMTKEGVLFPDADTRIVAERLALALGRYYAQRRAMEAEKDDAGVVDPPEAELYAHARFQELTNRTLPCIDALQKFDGGDELDIRKLLQMVNVTTNLLQVGTILAFRKHRKFEDRPVVDRTIMEDALRFLERAVGVVPNSDNAPRPRKSALILNYIIIARKLLGKDPLPGFVLDRGDSQDPHSDPGYEGWRKQALSEFDRELDTMTGPQREALLA